MHLIGKNGRRIFPEDMVVQSRVINAYEPSE